MTRRLVARLDNVGDVLLTGPAVRAIAAAGEPVVFLAGPAGAEAARLLPGVGEVMVFDAPWVAFDAPAISTDALAALISGVATSGVTEAIVFTSFHQSPLPLAMLLRLAGVARIGATCVDYPGTLLDVRHPYLERCHEVEQALSLADAMGHRLPSGDDGRLRIRRPAPDPNAEACPPTEPYVVLHPGSSVPARSLPDGVAAGVVDALSADGWHVAVTGSRSEMAVAQRLADDRPGVTSLAGRTDLVALANVVAGAGAVVCGNTGIAHLAAAVGTPVVEAFAPVVPAHRWRPWRVPHVLLGRLDVPCAGCRARVCPIAGQPCLAPFTPRAVTDAVATLTGADETVRAVAGGGA